MLLLLFFHNKRRMLAEGSKWGAKASEGKINRRKGEIS
jgi:hypothetical protein